MKSVTLVIPTFNSSFYLKKILKSKYISFFDEVIISDDSSSESEYQEIKMQLGEGHKLQTIHFIHNGLPHLQLGPKLPCQGDFCGDILKQEGNRAIGMRTARDRIDRA